MVSSPAELTALSLPFARRGRALLPWIAAAALLTGVYYVAGTILQRTGQVTVWDDQTSVFLQMVDHLAAPNQINAFKNPPWAAVLIAPFGVIADASVPIALIAQLFLYWLGLALVTRKFQRGRGTGRRAYLIALLSPFALDASLNLNLDWLVVYGLLVPAAYSGPLLLVKPQTAIGYLLTLSWKQWVRWLTVMLIAVILSLVLWGPWPLDWLAGNETKAIGTNVNIAPWIILTPWVSIPIGIGIGVIAARRRDAVLGVLAGLFVVPYVAFYSLLLPFTLAAVRWPRVALIISLALWVIVVIFTIGLSRTPV